MYIVLRMLTLAVVAGMFVVFIILLRRQKLDLKYCLVWLITLLAVAVFCIFPSLLDILSILLGIETPVNTLFLICIAFLTCICISLTIFVSSLSNRLRKLVQNIAMMEYERNAHIEQNKRSN